MRGHGHDGAGAVIHEDVVGDPDGHALAVERVETEALGVDAVLLDGANVAGFFGLDLLGEHFVDLGAEIGVLGDEIGDQRMFGRELQRGRAVDGVDTSGEDGDFVADGASGAIELEVDEGAFAAADPVALLRNDAIGPAGERVEVFEQLVGVVGNADEPLLQLALDDGRGFVTPAAAVGEHLLVGQDGGALRTPVDLGVFAIGEALLVELEEEPLVPAIVVGQAGGQLLRPIVGEAEALHLHLHGADVVQGPVAGRRLVLDGGVFGGQAEGVPAHGMEHVVALHPHVAGEGVADGVVADVSHVESAGGIGQHLEDVVLLARGGGWLGGIEREVGGPAVGPLLFDGLGVVAFGTVGGRIGVFGVGVGHVCAR